MCTDSIDSETHMDTLNTSDTFFVCKAHKYRATNTGKFRAERLSAFRWLQYTSCLEQTRQEHRSYLKTSRFHFINNKLIQHLIEEKSVDSVKYRLMKAYNHFERIGKA